MKLIAQNTITIFALLACLAVTSSRAADQLPDLTVTVVTISPVTVEAGDPLTMAIVITNNGAAAAAASVAKVVLSTDDAASADDHLLMEFNIPALDPRQSFTFTLTAMVPANTTAGEYYVCVTANADGAINESDSTNNTAVAVLHIGGSSPSPDLSVNALTLSKAHADAGEEFVAVVNVINQGSGNAPASVTEFRFGSSPTLTRNDTLLGTQNLGAIVAGQSETQTAVLHVPAGTQPGTYYVGAFVNADSAFDEVTYTNNQTAVAIIVGNGEAQMFTLTVTKAGTGGGTVTISPDQASYASGSTVALLATANPGSVFVGWSGTINSTGNALTLTIIANTTLVATFNLAEETNHAPIAINGAFNATPGTPVSGTLTATDEDGDALTFSIVSGPALGTVTLSGGNFVYVAPANATGTDSFTFKANDGEFDSNIATITIALGERQNQGPLVASATVSPNPAVVGETVTVTIVASDPENDALTYTFNWGDGSASTSSSTHVYSAAGTYTILAVVSDGENMFTVTLSLVVTAPAPVEAQPFTLQKFNARFRFERPAADCCSVTGVLPGVPAGMNFDGKTFSIDVGGAVRNFTLNARGKAESNGDSLCVKYQRGRNGTVALSFTAKLKGNLASHWADEGVDSNNDAVRQTCEMNITVNFDGSEYSKNARLILNVKAHKGGTLND